ncbi:MAG: hypothetical protein JWN13_4125 [Betaproteobacteria bacterium]|nr:hypothetical protein [Betaproteobacteria bacterium]
MKPTRLIAYGASALYIAAAGCAQYSGPQGARPSNASSGSGPTYVSGTKGSLHARNGETRQQMFDRLDTNHDGTISRSEAEASPDLMAIFVDTDANGDAVLSVAEFSVVPLIPEDASATGGTSGAGAGGALQVITPSQPNETQPGLMDGATPARY